MSEKKITAQEFNSILVDEMHRAGDNLFALLSLFEIANAETFKEYQRNGEVYDFRFSINKRGGNNMSLQKLIEKLSGLLSKAVHHETRRHTKEMSEVVQSNIDAKGTHDAPYKIPPQLPAWVKEASELLKNMSG